MTTSLQFIIDTRRVSRSDYTQLRTWLPLKPKGEGRVDIYITTLVSLGVLTVDRPKLFVMFALEPLGPAGHMYVL